jgi:spoIIIJ-associated protein
MMMSAKDDAKSVLETLLTKMGLEAAVDAREDEERITLVVGGPETGLVIGKKGQTLDALQYLVNKIVSQKLEDDEDGKPINVDSEGYRERRAESLVELAHRLAEKARRTGRPVAADPMSPADRRVIHVALADAEGLTTRSEGEGIYRHLVIIPTGPSPSDDSQ